MSASERLIVEPGERRDAVLEVIRSARETLVLSMFRANDEAVLEEIAAVAARDVRVEVLLTRRAGGGKRRLRRLWQFLEDAGAHVHGYVDPVVKYHAKYIVADDRVGQVGSLNLTRKCLNKTADFLVTTTDPDLVRSLVRLWETDAAGRSGAPEDLSRRLIVGPEQARTRLVELLGGARRRIAIIDPKLNDPEMVALLGARAAEGVEVQTLTGGRVGDWRAHGKLIIVDDQVAVIGSMSLSATSLDFRREVSLVIDDPAHVATLAAFFDNAAAAGPRDEEPPDRPQSATA